MEQKVCKNKNCKKLLPEGYRYKYCESCRNKQVDKVKKAGKPILGVATVAALGVKAIRVIIKSRL